MNRMLWLCGFVACVCIASPAAAGDYGQTEQSCYWCSRDGIYADVSLIDHLEANPDVDDGVKGLAFVEAAVKSSKANGKWTKL